MIDQDSKRWRRRRCWWTCLFAIALLFGGCTEAIETAGPPSQDAEDGDSGGDNDGIVTPDFTEPSNEEDPVVVIEAPEDGVSISSDSVTVEGTASDDSGLATVFVKVGPNSEEIAATDDGFRHWTFEAPTPVGEFDIEATAYDSDGRASETETITVQGRSASGDSQAPQVSIAEPVDGTTPLQTVVVLRGTTTDDIGVRSMQLMLNGDMLEERSFETSDNFESWSRRVPLLSGQENVLRVVAEDGAGNTGSDEISLFGRSQPDGERPEITISEPSADSTVNSGSIEVSGEASDNLAVREVKVRTGPEPAGGCQDRQNVQWIDYVQADSDDGFASWTADVMVDPGTQCVEARAIDVSGIAQSQIITITNNFQETWSEDELFFMRLNPFGTPPLVNLTLSKSGVGEVINESIQRDTVVSELDATDLLVNSLDTLKSACGVCWTGASSTPDERGGGTDSCGGVSDYDCTRTELGCSFGDENNNCAGWEDSPEYAMVRLLTLTPNNAELEGTSLGELQNLLGDVTREFLADLLAQTLQIDRNQSVVSTSGVATALRNDLIATHPNVVFNSSAPNIPLLRVTLYDALNDLAPLSERYGPEGAHPGILDPANPPFAEVFPSDTFRMILIGESNLRYHDGMNLSQGKDYMALVEDTNGPTFDDVVEFDFESEDRFEIVGLPPEPSIDLQFGISETPRDIPVCEGPSNESAGDPNCQQNRPDSPYQSQYVWSLDPWQLEYILADAGFETGYSQLNNYVTKSLGFAFILEARVYVGNAGGRRSYPPGWSEFEVSGLGTFIVPPLPPQQFLSETIMDLAEVIGHRNVGGPGGCPNEDYQICEGDLNVSFALKDIPTGVTAEQLENDSREFLQAQRDELAERLLGDFQENNGCLDFYYDSLGGKPMLIYADASDPRASDCPAPISDGAGFFTDAELTTKVSTTSVLGVDDTVHEKFVLSEGEETIYAPGADGNTYRLKLDVPNLNQSTDITIAIARKVR